MNVSIILPCFEEGETAIAFLKQLEEAILTLPHQFEIVLIDDGSSDESLSLLQNFSFSHPGLHFTLLHLPVNLGHQKAIYQAMCYVQKTNAARIIIMDADGEDDPAGIGLLLAEEAEIIQVKRGKRSEGVFFKMAYFFYQMLYALVTRKSMHVGNYCMIGRRALDQAVHRSFVHLGAFLQKLPFSHSSIRLDRGKRLAGDSKMSKAQLVEYGLMALVEQAPALLKMFFRLFLWVLFFLLLAGGFVLYHKLFTGKAILGWTSTLLIGMMNMALVSLGFFVLGTLWLNFASRQMPTQSPRLYEVIFSKK